MSTQSTKFGPGTVKRAFKNVGTTGEQEIVAAVSGKKIRVFAFVESTGVAQTYHWRSASTRISSDMRPNSFGANVWAYLEVGWFETVAGEALNGFFDAGTPDVHLHVIYVEVD